MYSILFSFFFLSLLTAGLYKTGTEISMDEINVQKVNILAILSSGKKKNRIRTESYQNGKEMNGSNGTNKTNRFASAINLPYLIPS
jgi:hypothetical protein